MDSKIVNAHVKNFCDNILYSFVCGEISEASREALREAIAAESPSVFFDLKLVGCDRSGVTIRFDVPRGEESWSVDSYGGNSIRCNGLRRRLVVLERAVDEIAWATSSD